jgi:hypothetical protein
MNRIYHTWEKWECYPAGLYEDRPPDGISVADAPQRYAEFLRDTPRFEAALHRVITEWPNSCEHYLSNENMNRIAWLGQASACIALRLPSMFRGGFHRLTEAEQRTANETALKYLNQWLASRGEAELSMDEAQSKTLPNLY